MEDERINALAIRKNPDVKRDFHDCQLDDSLKACQNESTWSSKITAVQMET